MPLIAAAPGREPLWSSIPIRLPRIEAARDQDNVLPTLLLLALTLRAAAALLTGIDHPDAVYQYLEPARRLLTGEGVVTWEWRVGMRGWLLPWLFAAPMAAARSLGFGPGWALLAARLCAAVASTGCVWAAWRIGARKSPTAALLAGFVAATWFDLVYFSAQTLSESVATAALIPAGALLTADPPSRRTLAVAGLLLGLAVLARPHYAPAAATMVAVWGWSKRLEPRRLAPLMLGAAAAFALGASADVAAGAPPLAWISEKVRQNLLLGKAAAFGTLPAGTYLLWLVNLWRWATVPIAFGVWRGRHACPPLFWAALANPLMHSLIGHKESSPLRLAPTGSLRPPCGELWDQYRPTKNRRVVRSRVRRRSQPGPQRCRCGEADARVRSCRR